MVQRAWEFSFISEKFLTKANANSHFLKELLTGMSLDESIPRWHRIFLSCIPQEEGSSY
jgi:hypothetical protein